MRAITKHYLRDARSQGLAGQVQGAAISVAHRMSSDLKLNLHWHVLLADGVWTEQDGHATFDPAAPLDTLRVQETLHDAVLRIDKLLKRKGWQGRLDDPFAESVPALTEPWKAALDGCWRTPRRFLSRGGRSTAAMKAHGQPSPNTRVSKPSTGRTNHTPRKLRRRNCLANPLFQRQSSAPIPDQPPPAASAILAP